MRIANYPKIGDVFGKWTVVGNRLSEKVGTGHSTRLRIPCACECGTTRNVIYKTLKTGESTSCGRGSCRNTDSYLLDFTKEKEYVVDGIVFKPHYSALFAVATCGQVLGKRGNILKPKSQGHYLIVSYTVLDGGISKSRNKYVHRLVAETWLDNPWNKEYVNHKDGDKLNNSIDNLEWVSPSENSVHAINLGLSWNLPSLGEYGFRSKHG